VRIVAPYTVGRAPFSVGGSIYFLPRLNAAADITPAVPAWDTLASYWARARMPQSRVVGDSIDVVQALTWAIFDTETCGERQHIGDPMPRGVDFTGAVAWCINRAATLSGTVRPWMSLRVFNLSGTILRATLLELGEHGSGTNMNANGTRLWARGAALNDYVSQDGDRLVADFGWSASNAATASTTYGSLSTIAGNEAALHVCSTAAEGVNPGSRSPYLELVGVTLP
jgi:hypothetical protein